ncbi:MAG: LptF/LptG family permease [Bacteroidaceae bacterium]|nr:LptF/LptG family permease [Bacteroidaceae bacterium]MBQ3238640.1 LptF/LptG family permease [Bacteroidaceae bacterium]
MFVGTFFICLFIFIMQALWLYVDELVGKGIPMDVLARFFYYTALALVPKSLPLAVLLAALITFGNFGERVELTAMKAAGVPLIRVMSPLIVLCVGLGVVSFYFQNVTVPHANLQMQTLLISMKQKSPELEIPEGAFYDGIENYNLYVKRKDNNTGMLYGVVIYNLSNGFENATVLKADSGRLETTADKQHLKMILYHGEQFENLKDGQINSKNIPYRREQFGEKTMLIEFNNDFDVMDGSFLSGNAMNKNMIQLNHDIDSLTAVQDSIGRAYFQQLNKNTYASYNLTKSDTAKLAEFVEEEQLTRINVDSLFHSATRDQRQKWLKNEESRINNLKNETALKTKTVFNADKNIRRHQIEWLNKITLSLACLVFFLIGAPLGAIIRKGGLGMPIVVSVFTFIVYYIIDNSGNNLAKEGAVPVWWGRWVSTFVLGPLGIFLTYQANKDSGVFNADLYKSALRWLLGMRAKRHNVIKEVIIDDPDYANICGELSALSVACKEYNRAYLTNLLPNYLGMFAAKDNRDSALLKLNEQLNHIAEQLGNSRSQEILNKVNSYPVVSLNAHAAPFPYKWLNVAAGVVLPVGVLLYARAIFFRHRLKGDLKRIVKTNKEIQNIIYERKL